MIPRGRRLTRRTFPKGGALNRLSSPAFSLSYGPAKEGGCAAVVSKSVARRAVARHLLKRRMLSIMSPWCRTDRYLVAYARAGAAKLPFKALKDELAGLLSRLTR